MDCPALRHLVDGYFHQDWYAVYGDEWLVIHDFVDGERDLASLLPGEIRALLAELSTETELQARLRALGSCYTVAPDTTYREWLSEVAARTEEYLARG